MPVVIDISYWQDPAKIDYVMLAENVDAVILRAVYGKWKDTRFDYHYDNLVKRSVPIGAYHYIIGGLTAKEQAVAMAEAVKGKEIRADYWNDVEDTREGTALTYDLVVQYMTEVEDRLGEFGIYSSRSKWDAIMKMPVFSTRKLWVANYEVSVPALPRTGGWGSYFLWQYTSGGSLPGYSGSLDMNKFNGGRQEFYDWVGAGGADKPEDLILFTGAVNASVLNVRAGPGLGYSVVGSVNYGDTVKVYESKEGWYRIGLSRWVHGAYIQKNVTYTDEEKLDILWEDYLERKEQT